MIRSLRDRVTNIVHKIGSTVLASVGYVRAADGEPTRISREDGTYVILSYDAALPITNEVHYSSGGSPVLTDSFGYDSAGNRIRVRTSVGNFGYMYEPGYRMRYVTNSAARFDCRRRKWRLWNETSKIRHRFRALEPILGAISWL